MKQQSRRLNAWDQRSEFVCTKILQHLFRDRPANSADFDVPHTGLLNARILSGQQQRQVLRVAGCGKRDDNRR